MIDNKQSDFDRDKTGEGQDIEEAVPGWIKYPHLSSEDEDQPFFVACEGLNMVFYKRTGPGF